MSMAAGDGSLALPGAHFFAIDPDRSIYRLGARSR